MKIVHSRLVIAASAAVLAFACGSDDKAPPPGDYTVFDPDASAGGSASTGGAPGSGGVATTGGAPGTDGGGAGSGGAPTDGGPGNGGSGNGGSGNGGSGNGGSTSLDAGPDAADAGEDPFVGTRIRGAASKGPFLANGTVDVWPVAAGVPAATKLVTAATDDDGRFVATFDYLGPVQLDATGGWFNELTGLSEASATLRAFVDVPAVGVQRAYVDPLTHVVHARAKTLMAGGASLTDAVMLAETELRNQLVLGGPAFDPNAKGSDLSVLDGDTEQAAYLLGMSSVSLLAAKVQATTAQGYLDAVQGSLASGVIDPGLIAAFNKAHRFLEPDDVMGKLAARFAATGFAGSVPNVNRVLDTDNDGHTNDTDNCVLVGNANQAAVRGVCAHHKVALPAPKDASVFGSWFPLTGDLEGDTDPDYVRVGLPNALLYTNGGASGFTLKAIDIASPLGFAAVFPLATVTSAAFGDLSGDGNADLLVSTALDGGPGSAATLKLFRGIGDGTFEAPVLLWSNQAAASSGLTWLTLADVDADSKLDVIAGMPGGSSGGNSVIAAVFLNPGAGAWATPTLVKVTGAANQAVAVRGFQVGRFNADAHVDVLALVGSASGGTVATPGLYLLSGNGAGGFTVGSPSTLADGCSGSLAVGDFDEDDALDVGVLDLKATKLTIAFGTGTGTFNGAVTLPVDAEPKIFAGPASGSGPCADTNTLGRPGFGAGKSLHAGHYTGGTHWDLAAGTTVFVSNGRSAPTQQFVRSATYATLPAGPTQIVSGPADADYDGDGSTDVVADWLGVIALVNPPNYRSW